MLGQFCDFRNALAIAHLACSSHPSPSSALDEMRSRGCWRSDEYNFFPFTIVQRTRPVSFGVASVRQFSRVQAALEREAAAAWPSLAVWLSGCPAPLARLRWERKPLDLILWHPFRGLSAHHDNRLAPCKTPHPVLFGPVLFYPALPYPWIMQ
jgi:hypothetical protein